MQTVPIKRLHRPAIAMLVAILVGGIGWLLSPATAVQPAAGDAQGKDAIAELKKELLRTARKTYELEFARFRNLQQSDFEQLARWSRRWLEAQLAVAADRDARLAAYREHLERMRGLETVAKAQTRAGQAMPSTASAAEYGRLQAELWLAEATATAKGQAK